MLFNHPAGKGGEADMRVSDLSIDRIYTNERTRKTEYEMVENHFHYYYEIYYVKHGTCRFFISDSLYDLHSGDFLIIPPKEVHFNRYLSQCTRANIYFRKTDLTDNGKWFVPEIDPFVSKVSFLHVPGSYRAIWENLIDEMTREDRLNDPLTPELLKLNLRRLFLYAVRFAVPHAQNAGITTESDAGILGAVQYITAHYNEPITLDFLAGRAGLSPSYFSRRFRMVTGTRMKEYLIYVRLGHAETELLSTAHTITEVAMNNGFSDSNYFKDAFRKMFGQSPRAYRASRTDKQDTAESLKEGTIQPDREP